MRQVYTLQFYFQVSPYMSYGATQLVSIWQTKGDFVRGLSSLFPRKRPYPQPGNSAQHKSRPRLINTSKRYEKRIERVEAGFPLPSDRLYTRPSDEHLYPEFYFLSLNPFQSRIKISRYDPIVIHRMISLTGNKPTAVIRICTGKRRQISGKYNLACN